MTNLNKKNELRRMNNYNSKKLKIEKNKKLNNYKIIFYS